MGHDARLFEDARQPDEGYVFQRMHHHPQTRTRDKTINRVLSINPNLVCVPNYRSARLYDDKLEQAAELARWMPHTEVFYSPGAARRYLETDPRFPIISKTKEGASSHNVRLLRTLDDANTEIKGAFSDIGIGAKYGQKQHGYLLWQKFCEGNSGDIRIIAVGDYRLILRRQNRRDRPMASGSGWNTPIKFMDDTLAAPLAKANEFFAAENFKWCGIDLVYDHDDKNWMVLETTVTWTLAGYADCAFLNAEGEQSGMFGRDIWQVLIKQLERGVFNG
jgi:glutathione synthase/RimK-type ligase-like ATP-grasp enzyme